MRRRGRALLWALLLAWLPFAALARSAGNDVHMFQIRPQSLTTALIRFSRQSDRQIVVASRIVPEHITAGLNGPMSIEAALETLLAGSGLTYELQGDHSVRIVAAPLTALAVAMTSVVPLEPIEQPVDEASPPFTSTLLGEVYVTARRIKESAQEVPIVVNVLTPELMTAQDMRSFTDVERMVPAVSTCCGRSSVSAFTFIRGVNNAVGYFAEVPTLLNGNALYFDMANVQVLKGPQGTLFGISTNGGAILYEPQQPVQRMEGYAAVTGGGRDRRSAEAVINLPLTDSLWMRIGAMQHHSDGYVREVSEGAMLGTEDFWTGRIAMTYRASRLTTSSVLNVHHSDRIPEPLGVPYGPDAGINPTGSVATAFAGPALDAWIRQQQGLGPYEIVGMSVAGGPHQTLDQVNLINTTTYQLTPSVRLRNVVGFVQDQSRSVVDTDATPFPIFETSYPTEFPGPNRQYTEELQLQGTAFDDALTYVMGTFNRWSKQDDPATMYSYSFGVRSGTRSRAEGNTASFFAEGTYSLSSLLEGLQFTAGYRFTRDAREAAQVRYDATGAEISRFDADGAWGRGSYRWGLAFTPMPQLMLYFMNSKGYSAGGFNLIAPPDLRRYDPEILNNYEVGIKSEHRWFGRPLRLNLSAYYGDWDNMQAQVTSRCETSTGIVFCQLTRNAATGEIYGVEGEFMIKPFDALSLSGNFAYMRGRYNEFFGSTPTGDCCVDLSRVPFLYVPKWKYSLNARLDLPLQPALGSLNLSAAYSYTDDLHCCFTLGKPQYWTVSPSMENLNLSLNWHDVAGWKQLSVAAVVTNVTQNRILQGQWGVYETLGHYARAVALPRSWSLQLRYDF